MILYLYVMEVTRHKHKIASKKQLVTLLSNTHIYLSLYPDVMSQARMISAALTQGMKVGRKEKERDGSYHLCFRVEMATEERHLKPKQSQFLPPTNQRVSCKLLKKEVCQYFVQSVSQNLKSATVYVGLQTQNATTYFTKTASFSG